VSEHTIEVTPMFERPLSELAREITEGGGAALRRHGGVAGARG
jgi:hypothetical protein